MSPQGDHEIELAGIMQYLHKRPKQERQWQRTCVIRDQDKEPLIPEPAVERLMQGLEDLVV